MTEENLGGARVVELRRPYDTLHTSTTARWIADIAAFKTRSYRESYPYGILPFDGVDLIATHVLLVDAAGVIRMGFKVVTQHDCERFHLRFPVYGFLGPEQVAQRAAIVRVLSTPTPVGYYGSWAIDAALRAVPAWAALCRDVTTLGVVRIAESLGFEAAVTVAMRRFKVEKYHAWLGMTALGDDGGAFPCHRSDMMMGEPCSISVLRSFSPEALGVAEHMATAWNTREIVGA